MITAHLELISPERAKLLLEQTNIGNRRLRRWWAIALASAIRRGEWITTHQGIAFTESGRLIDGQHRLEAIALSGQSVQVWIFKDVPDEAFKVIDVGVKRSNADTTGLEKRTAEVARLIAKIVHSGSVVSAHTVLEIADSGVSELHERLMQHCATNRAAYTAAPVRAAAIALVMDGHNEQDVFSTYANLVYQRFDQLPPVAHSFIRQVSDKKVNTGRISDVLARALKTLNPHNKMITKIQVSESDCSAANEYVRKLFGRVVEAPVSTPKRTSTATFTEFFNQRIAA